MYDFVAEYTKSGVDKDGNRVYCKLGKPLLPNHKLYNPGKEDGREKFFYSLFLLFVPFRDEGDLIEEGETAESAFERHMQENEALNTHSEKLQHMLRARETVQKINEARPTQEEDVSDSSSEAENGPQVAGEAISAMNDVADLCQDNDSDGPSLEELVSSLNPNQVRVFEKVKSHL